MVPTPLVAPGPSSRTTTSLPSSGSTKPVQLRQRGFTLKPLIPTLTVISTTSLHEVRFSLEEVLARTLLVRAIGDHGLIQGGQDLSDKLPIRS